jgi:hypothetical protein
MSNLKVAKQNYVKGSYFISATGNLRKPIKVTNLKISEITGDIIEENGGVIYDKELDVWAKIF